jgi:hypothetical protein
MRLNGIISYTILGHDLILDLNETSLGRSGWTVHTIIPSRSVHGTSASSRKFSRNFFFQKNLAKIFQALRMWADLHVPNVTVVDNFPARLRAEKLTINWIIDIGIAMDIAVILHYAIKLATPTELQHAFDRYSQKQDLQNANVFNIKVWLRSPPSSRIIILFMAGILLDMKQRHQSFTFWQL